MTTARQDLITLGASGWFHLVNRCVRRAFLCGEDVVSGHNYDHRRGWIRDRLLELSNLFAIDVYAFSVMSNHYHAVVFVDVERLHGWDDEEIARRWLRLCPPRAARENGAIQEDSTVFQGAITALLADAERLVTCRERLGDIS